MWSTMVRPSAASPAKTRAALARRSQARDARAAETRHARDGRRAVVASDFGSQTVQLGHVQESAGKDAVFAPG